MFKNLRSVLFFVGVVSVLSIVACTNNADDVDSNAVNFNNIRQKSADNEITVDLLDLGVKEVKNDGRTMTFVTYNDFFYKTAVVNFASYTINYDATSLSTNNSKLVISGGETYLYKNNQMLNIRSISSSALTPDDLVLVIANGQVHPSYGGPRLTFDDYQSTIGGGHGAGCPIWNIRRAMGWGLTTSESDADLWAATQEFVSQHQGCTSIGGVAHKDFGFTSVSIQSFCCK